jgi:hypothetical protein
MRNPVHKVTTTYSSPDTITYNTLLSFKEALWMFSSPIRIRLHCIPCKTQCVKSLLYSLVGPCHFPRSTTCQYISVFYQNTLALLSINQAYSIVHFIYITPGLKILNPSSRSAKLSSNCYPIIARGVAVRTTCINGIIVVV